jgi:hypothetical protein
VSRYRSAAAIVAVALILASCSGGSSENDRAGDPASAAEIESVLAATARQRVNVDNSFGGRTAFRAVSIVERLGIGTRNGMVDTRSPGGRLLTVSEKSAIATALSPMTVEWVPDIQAVIGTGPLPTFREIKAVLTLAVPRFSNGRAEATSELWCGGTCGAGSTHVLEPATDGTWSVTGTTGIGFVA